MIERYTTPEMGAIVSLRHKYELWLQVEIAVLWALWHDNQITKKAYEEIRQKVEFDVERITYLDEGPDNPTPFHHDMNAFIEACKEHMREAGVSEKVINLFHIKITSYDTEDPAFSLKLISATELLQSSLEELIYNLLKRARDHEETYMMGITHGQAAEPITLALKLFNFIAALKRDLERLQASKEKMHVSKLSGAVGTYNQLSPKIEELALNQLGLEPVSASTQIVHRDIHARLASDICIMISNLGHIANNLWLMCQFPRCEAQEPFGKKQRGSSIMPHKKNPILLERMRGMATIARGYLSSIMESIPTYDERAIDQSCVERVAYNDLLLLAHYMLVKMAKVIEGMVFFPEKMIENIESALGLWASGNVKSMLLEQGISELKFGAEKKTLSVYEWVQRCAFYAKQNNQHLLDVLKTPGGIILQWKAVTPIDVDDQIQLINGCFDYKHHLQHLPAVYNRFSSIT